MEVLEQRIEEAATESAIVVQPRSCRVAEAWPIHDDAAAVIEPPGESFQLIPGRDRAHGRQHQDRVGTRWTRALVPDRHGRPAPAPGERVRFNQWGSDRPSLAQAAASRSSADGLDDAPSPEAGVTLPAIEVAGIATFGHTSSPVPGVPGGASSPSAIILLPRGGATGSVPSVLSLTAHSPFSSPQRSAGILHPRRCVTVRTHRRCPGATACLASLATEASRRCSYASFGVLTWSCRPPPLFGGRTCRSMLPPERGSLPLRGCDNWISPVGTRNLRRGSSARRSLLRCGQPGTRQAAAH